MDALADVLLHFQRLQSELAIKSAIAQDALGKVEKLLSNPDSREVTSFAGDREDGNRSEMDDNRSVMDDNRSEMEDKRQKRRENVIIDRPYRSPLKEVITHLPPGYYKRYYESYLDFAKRRQAIARKEAEEEEVIG